MDQIKLLNFADYFFISGSEDIKEIKEELFEAGINSDESQNKILNYLRQQRAEVLLETGRKFKETFLKLKAENTIKDSANEFAHSDIALAYRKKSGNSNKAEDEDSSKMDLVRLAKKRTT